MRLSILLCFVPLLAGCTPKEGEPVNITQLFTDAKLDKKYGAVTGIVGISTGIMGSTSCKGGRCNIELKVPDSAWKAPKGMLGFVKLDVGVGSGENEMAELPDKYSKADLKLKAMGGKILKAGDKVKVSGTLYCHGNNNEDRLPCEIRVDRIDVP